MLLLDLPSDILELICGELDAYSAVACAQASKVLHHIVATSLLVRYTIALAMRGMRAGKKESISIAERLEMLKRYEEAWFQDSREESFRITLPEPMPLIDRGNLHVHHADGYLLTWLVETGQVHVVRLPSPLRGISLEEYRWQFALPPNPDRFQTVVLLDPQKDLVMFVEETVVGPEKHQRCVEVYTR